MPIKVEKYDRTVSMRDLPVGEACRRLADGEYFIKTNETTNDGISFICVSLSTFNIHRIRHSTVVQVVPATTIKLSWENTVPKYPRTCFHIDETPLRRCPSCGRDLSEEGAIKLVLKVAGTVLEVPSHLNHGYIVDTEERLVAHGFLVNTICVGCSKALIDNDGVIGSVSA